MQCPSCQGDVVPEAVFCQHCGARLVAQQKVAADDSAAADPLGPAPPAASSAAGGMESSPSRGQGVMRRGTNTQDDPPERELWRGTYSPRAMIPHAVAALAASVVAIVVGVLLKLGAAGWMWLLGLMVLGWAVLALRLWLVRLSVSYLLTNQRLIHELGLLRRSRNRVEVIDIDDVSFVQGVVDRLLGIGTVRVSSTDRTDPVLVLRGIEGVRGVADEIDRVRRHERIRRGLHIETS